MERTVDPWKAFLSLRPIKEFLYPLRINMKRAVSSAAVDLGATSGRVIVGTWASGKLELKEVHRFPNQFRTLGTSSFWDLPYLWEQVAEGLRKAKQAFPKLASVGVDSWGVDHVLLNEAGRLVFPTHAYRDSRTQPYAEALDKQGLERVYELTGLPNYPYNTSLQLQESLASAPGLRSSVARCLFISDYFNYLLSGKMENEISACSHSQLLDVKACDWSEQAFSFFGVPRTWFGKPALAGTVLGPVTGLPELKKTLSILAPGHDTGSAYTAMPAAPDGTDLYLSSGTWSLLGYESEVPLASPEALAARVSNERMGDGRYRPLGSCLGLWLLEQTVKSFGEAPRSRAAWDKLAAAAARLPRPRLLLDVSDKKLFNPKDMRKAIDAQLRSNRVKAPTALAAYMRLICDSLGAGHAATVRNFERLSGRRFSRLLMVGGGSRNSLLCQATADASALPVHSFSLEGSAVGNLATQFIALGAVKDLATFRSQLAAQLDVKIYEPKASHAK